MPETPQNLPPLPDLPLTPSLANSEIHHIVGSISRSNSPNIDFDTAAFMLMSNDNATHTASSIVANHAFLNSPKFQNSSNNAQSNNNQTNHNFFGVNTLDTNVKLPSLNLSHFNPPSPFSAATPNTNNFDFESIGQMLMSPKTNQLIDSSLNTNPSFADGLHNTLLKEYPLSGLTSPNINAWNFNTQSPHMPIYAPSPTNSIGIMSNVLPKSPVSLSAASLNLTSGMIGLGMMDQYMPPGYNNGLLSNTESMALESFLDSIANEGSNRKEKKRKFDIREGVDDLFLQEESNDHQETLDNRVGKEKIKNEAKSAFSKTKAKTKAIVSKKSKIEDIQRKQLSKKERQLAHNITEQKRRNMIKAAFEKLQEMIINSKFDLHVKNETEQFKKRRKRKSKSEKPKNLKKYEVLQRSVREIDLLVQKNWELYRLLGETETTQKIDVVEGDEYTKEEDQKFSINSEQS